MYTLVEQTNRTWTITPSFFAGKNYQRLSTKEAYEPIDALQENPAYVKTVLGTSNTLPNGDAKYEDINDKHVVTNSETSVYDADGYLIATPKPSMIRKGEYGKANTYANDVERKLQDVAENLKEKIEPDADVDYDDVEGHDPEKKVEKKISENKEDQSEEDTKVTMRKNEDNAENKEEKTYLRLIGGGTITRESKL